MDKINLSDEQKCGIVIGYHHSYKFYNELMEKNGVKSKDTIAKILNKYQVQQDVSNNFHMCGRESLLTGEFEELVQDNVDNQMLIKYSINDIKAKLSKKFNIELSRSLIYSLIHKIGLKYGRIKPEYPITQNQFVNRKKFCKQHSCQSLDFFYFTDESIFSLKDNKIDIWYNTDDRKQSNYSNVSYKNANIHIWAGVGKLGKTAIFVFESSVNSKEYQKCLEIAFIPFNNLHNHKVLLFQDGKTSHTSQDTEQFLKQNQIIKIQNSAYSPDFNAKEMIWAIMKAHFNKQKTNHVIQNRIQLINQINQIWDETITQQLINNVIDYISEHMKDIFELDGQLK